MTPQLFPPFEAAMPVWGHTDLDSFTHHFKQTYSGKVLRKVLRRAKQHDRELTLLPDVASGLLWVPNPDGVPDGLGYMRLYDLEQPTSIDQELAQRETYYAMNMETVHEYALSRVEDMPQGPAGIQLRVFSTTLDPSVKTSLTVWVVPDPHTVIEVNVTYLKRDSDQEPFDAVARFISLSDYRPRD